MSDQLCNKETVQGQIYKTRQRAFIEQALSSAGEHHITADELTEQLEKDGHPVGRTTVYRCLERLVNEGKLQKYTAIGGSACYQRLKADGCCEHFHLKCTECGKLIHIECSKISKLSEHIAAEHGFVVNKLKTVLYGLCEECAKK